MNNQFATQFLREEEGTGWFEEMMKDYGADETFIAYAKMMVDKGLITPEKAIEIFKQTIGLDEMDGGGGGSTTGGGSTAGATFTPGTGEQYAAGTRKKKVYESDEGHRFEVGDKVKYNNQECEVIGLLDWGYRVKGPHFTSNVTKDTLERQNPAVKEDAPRLAGSPAKTTSQGAKNLSAYSSVGFTKAPSAEEAGKKMKSIDVKMLWKEGEKQAEVSWSMIEKAVKELGKKHLGIDSESRAGQEFLAYMKDAFHQGLITNKNELLHTIHGYKETLRESRAYSQFKKQTAMRPKDQQMHEAVKMIHKKLEEVSKLVEFAQQMRNELSEGENTLEYKHNTKKIFEKINSKVVEVYTKTRELK